MTSPEPSRSRLVRLQNVTFFLHGGSSEEYQRLMRALLESSVQGDPFGPIMIAKRVSGRWLVLAGDSSLRGQVLACLEHAGIPADALHAD